MKVIAYKDYKSCRLLCKKVKTGDLESIEKAVDVLHDLIHTDSTLVPVPSRFGRASYTLMIAVRMAMKYGFKVENCLYGDVRDSLCDMKKTGVELQTPVFKKRYKPAKESRLVLLDNVYDTGTTARAAKTALNRKCDILVIGRT